MSRICTVCHTKQHNQPTHSIRPPMAAAWAMASSPISPSPTAIPSMMNWLICCCPSGSSWSSCSCGSPSFCSSSSSASISFWSPSPSAAAAGWSMLSANRLVLYANVASTTAVARSGATRRKNECSSSTTTRFCTHTKMTQVRGEMVECRHFCGCRGAEGWSAAAERVLYRLEGWWVEEGEREREKGSARRSGAQRGAWVSE
mmetsp:Transcript_8395/g.23909  ORF Transcript_8395/g.23909 Transcript_8395/m.23909 type:complete len:202 (+) Transcript_8395:82-687(+)